MAPEGNGNLTLAAPAPGEELVMQIPGGGVVDLGNLLEQVTGMTRSEDGTLTLSFEDGGSLALQGFFPPEDAAEGAAEPVLVIDGQEVPYELFMAAYGDQLETAAGPAAGGRTGTGSGGAYRDGAGNLIDGLDALGKLGIIDWNREIIREIEDEGQRDPANLSIGFGAPGAMYGMLLSSRDINESENGLDLLIRLDRPANGEITLTLQIAGNVTLGNASTPADQLYNVDIFLPDNVTILPGNQLELTIPSGAYGADLNFTLNDDHVSELPESLSISIIRAEGHVVLEGRPTASINISDDMLAHAGGSHADNEIYVLDGPVVGLVRTDTDQSNPLYEGSPKSDFQFRISMDDPHSLAAGEADAAYKGYEQNGLLSQDMTVTLNFGDGAAAGDASASPDADYHLFPTPELEQLRVDGMISYETNPDGSLKVEADASFSITIYGQLDAAGNPHADGSVPFELSRLSALSINGKIHINGSDPAGETSPENIVINVETSGNESQAAPGALEIVIENDPIFGLNITADSVNESESRFNVTLTLDSALAAGLTFAATLSIPDSSAARLWNGDANERFMADYFLPGTDSGDGLTYTYTTPDGQDITLINNQDGSISVQGPAEAFIPDGNGAYSLDLPFVPNDDHISENTERLELVLDEVRLSDGVYSGTVSVDPAAADSISFTEDSQAAHTHAAGEEKDVLDGPIVSVVNAGAASVNEVDNARLDFEIRLFDPHSPDPANPLPYAGYAADGLLSQNMTISIAVGGSAGYGSDYTLDLSAIRAIPGVISAEYQNGGITLELRGRTDADGNPTDGEVFQVNSQLKFGADIINDTLTEAAAEDISFTVTAAEYNEAQTGSGTRSEIAQDTPAHFSGPVYSVSAPQLVDESGAGDSGLPFAVTHNLMHVDLNVSGRNSANAGADEAVSVNMRLEGTGGATAAGFNPVAPEAAAPGAFSPDADAWWAGVDTWALNIGGISYTSPVYDPTAGSIIFSLNNGEIFEITKVKFNADGSVDLTMPAGDWGAPQVSLSIGVGISDDLRETETGEGFRASISLAEKAPGLTYGEASIAPGKDSASTTIIDDLRNGELSPATHDGPWVSIAAAHIDPAGQYVDETGKIVQESSEASTRFVISLKDPYTADPAARAPYAADEPVSVTLKIDGGEGFNLSDLFRPQPDGEINPQITVTYYDENGQPAGSAVIGLTDAGRAWDESGELTLTMPAGAAFAQLELPVNDDPLGGSGSGLDLSSESFSLTITSVNGNEARVENAAAGKTDTEISDNDDSPGKEFDGLNIGLAWENGSPDININEGSSDTLGLILKNAHGQLIAGDASNPYAGYTSNNSLPETTTVSLNFANTPSANSDLAYTCSDKLEALLDAGKVSICINGQTFTSAADLNSHLAAQTPQGFDGKVDVNLIGGKFGADNADWQSITFKAHARGDNISEYDSKAPYNNGAEEESLGVTLTAVNGLNEAKIDSAHTSIEATILDKANGVIELSGGAFTAPSGNGDFGHWSFKLNLKYSNDERGNDPYAASDPWMSKAGEPLHLQLKISDSAAMHQGEEYVVNAFTLFLSMNGLAGAQTLPAGGQDYAVDDLESYNLWLDALGADSAAQWREACGEAGLILVRDPDYELNSPAPSEDWSKGGANLYDVFAPENTFDSKGNIEFTIERGAHGGVEGGFKVEAVNPKDTGDLPMAEVVSIKGSVNVAEAGDSIRMFLEGGKTIWEDSVSGSRETVDSYRVLFENSINPGNPGAAAGDISFRLSFTPRDGRPVFDFNLADNARLDTWGGTDGVGDVGLFITDAGGAQVHYAGKGEMLDALNAELARRYDGKVSVNDVETGANGKLTFKITAAEGFDLSQGIEINFMALDDSIDDDKELFRVQISNIEAPDYLSAVIEGNREGETLVRDETGAALSDYRNGFAISVEESAGYEANIKSMGDGNIYVTTRAFILDDKSNQAMDLQTLYHNFLSQSGGNPADIAGLSLPELAVLANGSPEFAQFMQTWYAPTQNITLNFDMGGRSSEAGGNQDYVVKNEQLLAPDAWALVIDASGNIFYEAAGENGLKIETVRDFLSEGNESFYLQLTGVSGNESRPCAAEDFSSWNWAGALSPASGADITVIDVHDSMQIVGFGPSGAMVMEPIDYAHGATLEDGAWQEHQVAPRAVDYKIELSEAALESVAVWFDHSGSGADYGKDFIFGNNGVYFSERVDGELKIYALNTDGLPDRSSPLNPVDLFSDGIPEAFMQQGGEGYFVIIGRNEAAVEFPVLIMDDNDTSAVGGGVDQGLEKILLTITQVVGSEITVEAEGGYFIPWDTDIAFEFGFKDAGGALIEGVIDPLAQTFTPHDTAFGGPFSFGAADSPAWLPATAPTALSVSGARSEFSSDQTILDDMHGPRLVIDYDPADRSIGLDMPDICAEDVKVSINLFAENIYRPDGSDDIIGTLSFTIPAGVKGMDGLTLAEIQHILANPADPLHGQIELAGALPGINQGFYMQIAESQGGEATADTRFVRVFGSGGDGNPPVLKNLESVKDIEENSANPDYAAYSFTMDVNASSRDVEFDIIFRPDSAVADDMNDPASFSAAGKVTVDIPGELLARLGPDAGEVRFEVRADADGAPRLYYDNGSGQCDALVHGADVSGVLPSACTDARIDGNESFYALIGRSEGALNLAEATSTTIIDKTFSKVILFGPDGNLLDGNYPCEEGDIIQVTARLIVTNEQGEPLRADGSVIDTSAPGWEQELVAAQPKHPLEFDVSHSSPNTEGHAEYNGDYSSDSSLVIGPDGNGAFELKIYEDMLSEGDESFNIGITPAPQGEDEQGNPIYDYPGEVAQVLPNSQSGSLTIANTQNGPLVSSEFAASVREDGVLAVNFNAWSRDADHIRQVVEEDVELTFLLSSKNGGLSVVEDLAAISYGGVTAAINPDGSVAWSSEPHPGFELRPVTDGAGAVSGYEVVVTMPRGTAMGSFSITPRDDARSENGEAFKVELVKTEGSETSIHPAEAAGTVNVTEHINGYIASIEPVHGEESGHAGIEVNFQTAGRRAPDEPVHFEFNLDPARAELDGSGIIEITLPDGRPVQFDLSNPAANPAWMSWNEAEGRLTLDVPAENFVPTITGLKVEFPINDNSVKGSSADFEIGVSISGGEINFGALPAFGSEFASETAAGRNDGGKTAFEINHESGSGSLSSVVGTTQISLSEIDPGIVSDVSVSWPGGSRTFSEDDWNVTGSGLELTGLPIENGYSVEITYRQPADDAEAALIAAAKENVGVSANVISSGKAVSVNAVDEPAAEQDMISLSYALDPTSLDADGNIVEGSEVTGVINVQMPNLPGDHGIVAGDVSFSFQMPSGAAGQLYNINWADSLPNGVSVNPIIGRPDFYQIEIEAGSPIPANGNFQIGFAIEADDNALLANPEFSLGIGNPSAPAYEGIKIAAGSGAGATGWKLVDETDAADGPAFSVEASAAQVVEGSVFSFSISSDADSQIWREAAGRPVTLEIAIDGLSAGDQIQLSNGSWYTVQADDFGSYTLSWPVTPSPAGDMPEISLNVRAADLEDLNPTREISARVSGVDTFEGFSSGSAGVAVSTSNHVELSLARGAFNQAGQSMMFTIAMAAAGFALSNGGLPEDVKLTLNLGEMTGAEKEALAAELSARPGVAAVYAEADDKFELTLEQGYADSELDFAIPVTQNGEYNVRIEGVEGSGLLAAPQIDAAANGDTFSLAHGEGSVKNLGSDDEPLFMETVNGDSGDDILIAADGISSLLLGEDGNDILIGASGDDILQGGRGNDVMSGGAGENTFLWNRGDLGGVDNILDLKEIDNIDLRDLFSDVELEEGELSVQALLDNGYLAIEENSSDASALDIKISTSGQADTAAEQIITVNFADTSLDQEQQMEQLIQQVLLVTDS